MQYVQIHTFFNVYQVRTERNNQLSGFDSREGINCLFSHPNSQNHKMAWVGSDLKDDLFPNSHHGQECHPVILDQDAQGNS